MNENEKDEELTEAEEELTEAEEEPDEDEDEFSEEDYEEDEDGNEEAGASDDSNNEDPAPESQPEPPKESEAEHKYNVMVKQARKALKSMGVEVENDEDVLTELERITAEANGQTLEEYRKSESDNAEAVSAQEERFANDLKAIQEAYPSAKAYSHLRELPNVKRFAELMGTGKVSAVEAFKLSHPNEAEAAIVKSVKQSSLNDTKSHLKSNIPKKSGAESPISKSDMREYREMFPDLSTKEIEALRRRVSH